MSINSFNLSKESSLAYPLVASDDSSDSKILYAEPDKKPIAFGDFRYYWVVGRQPVCIRPLVEKYIAIDCIGYRAYEFLDGKLVRPEAIKVMQMTDNAA